LDSLKTFAEIDLAFGQLFCPYGTAVIEHANTLVGVNFQLVPGVSCR
jgi:hypothetical protein